MRACARPLPDLHWSEEEEDPAENAYHDFSSKPPSLLHFFFRVMCSYLTAFLVTSYKKSNAGASGKHRLFRTITDLLSLSLSDMDAPGGL